jgi:hypothetical protein
MYQGLDTARGGYIKNLNTLGTLFIGNLNTHFEDPHPKNRTKKDDCSHTPKVVPPAEGERINIC